MVAQVYNPVTWDTKAKEGPLIQEQFSLHSETFSHKTKQKKEV